MGEMRFTPGPWRVENVGTDCDETMIVTDALKDIDGDPRAIVDMFHGGFVHPEKGMYEANVHLIAAAPLMYCQIDEAPDCDLLSPDEFYNAYRQWLIDAKHTLAKARGEQP